ncbi:transglutaminase domain-containing protein [Cohnella xylanilytica]|uniref:Transglutaminase domain-containing protein n=1 Tax=Cohnella xylanilytica TaxID=557555 RepID=A0A841TV12_9BACL|nr:transglutaminase domain-containing protein [Cohnella xylanilytica]MBB6692015.1 transglutaminase domain-containing protein [Cohnella xylanilytica]
MNPPDTNLVTVALLAVVAVSLVQGVWRGATGSAKRLFSFVAGAAMTLASVALAAWTASAASPAVQAWLVRRAWEQPKADSSIFIQIAYTVYSGIRDLPLLRFAVLFLIAYLMLRLVFGTIGSLLIRVGALPFSLVPSGGAVSRAFGGLIGAALGCGRALLLTVLLFGYCALFPQAPYADYVAESGLYQEAAARIIEPAAGRLIEERLPVFARKMQGELDQLWQKRYDVIDADLPSDIVLAAEKVTEGDETDEQKAKDLYNWVGSRIVYDYDKVTAYEERGEWREQTPSDTFSTRKGVCIDYARLYAAMARSVGLQVRVVTGLGYDGMGGYGPHAWNEVYLTEREAWVPLDATWAKTGDWFDPPGFQETHVRQA